MNYFILILGAFVASLISGVTGLGGGTLLMAVMSTMIGAPVLIPAHGAVQLGSNFSRVFLNRSVIDRKIATQYLFGAVFGALLGFSFNINISARAIGFLVSIFILVTTWVSFEKVSGFRNIKNYSILGFFSTVLSLFIGVTGPLVHPFILKEKHLSRAGFIGTEAFCAGSTHLLKVIIFGSWGVSLLPHWEILTTMILVTFLGAYIGKNVLHRIKDRHFLILIKVVITLLACRLFYSSLIG